MKVNKIYNNNYTLLYMVSRSAINSNWVNLNVIKWLRCLYAWFDEWCKHCVFLL